MGFKKSISKIVNRQTDGLLYSSTIKRITSIINITKSRSLEILYISGLFLFSAGIINGLIEGPRLPQGYVIFPQRGIQTPTEIFVYLFISVLGTFGFYLVYLGSHDNFKKRVSNLYIIFGFSSVLLAIVFIFYIFFTKF